MFVPVLCACLIIYATAAFARDICYAIRLHDDGFYLVFCEFDSLSGLSPFMGGTDVETMANVTIGKYDFDDEAFVTVSKDALDFIRKLLVKDSG